ncbi:MAG: di-trans,poly-cis-decaprenylcistransferase [Holophagales bacterium]|nr:di-trans,poly-cis-decaprenylcistransferase [Holophagales bacterium]
MRIEQAHGEGGSGPQEEAAAGPRHVAVIMDGNGRWATRRGLPRAIGHRAGASAVRRIVESARRRGIATLTLFAFSADNWRRPAAEVEALMRLFERYLAREARRCEENGIRLRVIGRRDRLGVSLVRAIDAAEAFTADGEAMELRIAVDYSGRDAILAAVALLPAGIPPSRLDLLSALGWAGCGGPPEVDLLVRTGGEHRISDFLLWESAYAEVFFSDRLWPDVTDADLAEALAWFSRRERRFGGLPSTVSIPAPPSGGANATPVRAA